MTKQNLSKLTLGLFYKTLELQWPVFSCLGGAGYIRKFLSDLIDTKVAFINTSYDENREMITLVTKI